MAVVGYFSNLRLLYILAVVIAFQSMGCSPAKISPSYSCSSRASVVYNAVAERAYCTTTYTHSSPVSVSGHATYQFRPYNGSGLGNIDTTGNPIRFAEVIAYNQNGSIVQCGETDLNGDYSMLLPNSTATHTIRIFSRGSNSNVNASVLNCPEENTPYYIETTVVPSSTPITGIDLQADAANSGTMLGAAFNIFDQIVNANEFLRAQVSNCTFTGCTDFTVAPKVQAYWTKGFNPNNYFDDSSGISFYIPGYSRLFILGGINGDIYNMDTDHFDNSIIIHEYGHFLEDVFSVSDSPGGSHGGNAIIDPRLAWSEGWGNFIQAAVRNQARYRDTQGTPNTSNPTSTSSYIFNIPIESPSLTCSVGSTTPGCDIPEFAYEGNFREFSVTRLLWDVYDQNITNPDSTGDESINNDFDEIWASITSNLGFKNTNAEFRNIGLLHYVQENNFAGASDWSSLLTMHNQGDFHEYARYIDNTGSCGKVFTMDPYDDPNDNGSFATSHLVRNNEFLHYHHTGGPFNLTLKYQTVDAGSNGYNTERATDLDLYVYNSAANYADASDMVATAETFWTNVASQEQTETITKSNLAAGDYLINIKVFTGRYLLDNNPSTTNCIGSGAFQICEDSTFPYSDYIPAGDPLTYELILNGVNLCPAALP